MIHKLDEFYCTFYSLTLKLPKRNRFGICTRIENIYFEVLELVIEASFETKLNKVLLLSKTRIKVEIIKRLIRSAFNLKIIEDKNYLILESFLQEVSRMINGWINFMKNK